MTMPPNTTSCTGFFKVILSSTLQNGKLKIPKNFVKDHGDELRECVSFSIPPGCSWSVNVRRETDGSIWFHDGLLKFMEDNSIGIEFFLWFKYRGGSKFSVIICDLTATEIQYNCNNSSTSDVNQIQNSDIRDCIGDSRKADSGDDSIECLGSSAGHLFSPISAEPSISAVGHKRSKGVSCETDKIVRCYLTRRKKQILDGQIEVDGVNVCSTLPTFAEPSRPGSRQKREKCLLLQTDKIGTKKQILDRDRMVGTVNVCSTLPQRRDDISNSSREWANERTIQDHNMPCPTFKVTLKSYNIKKSILVVPSEFVRVNIPHSTKLITLLDSDDNEWVVHFISRRTYYLASGWMQFVKDKKLMEGDVCIFERIGGNEVKLKTNICTSAVCTDGKNSNMYKDIGRFDACDGSGWNFGKERTIEAENNPLPNFFEVTLTPSYIKSGYLNVLSNFAQFLAPPNSTRLIKIEDANNKEWVVRFIRKQGNHRLSQGWRTFVQEKKLMVGDVCRFEHVRGDEVKMKVTISRPIK
ncbi:hypothetical protein Leryth_023051 [Lithospermum erythrorhizon]|nr:hypothetical protein Leryth_023051 [Lithospermum erythrorhizon]